MLSWPATGMTCSCVILGVVDKVIGVFRCESDSGGLKAP
jgi:hypothetical protein